MAAGIEQNTLENKTAVPIEEEYVRAAFVLRFSSAQDTRKQT